MRISPPIVIDEATRRELERQSLKRSMAVRVVLRSRIVLLAVEGNQNKQIAEHLGVSTRMAALWRGRFIEHGIEGLLKDAPRPGRTPRITVEIVDAVVAKTTQSTPANATHWSTRTMLFAALNTATGEVYHLCQQRHRHHEWLKFLRLIDQTVASDKQIHIVCDNYATHKHKRVQRWMDRHKRFHVHFTPTSASWLNMIERFFRDLTENRIWRGVFQVLEQLIVAIRDYFDRHNDNPKPFIWTAKANNILEKVTRAQTARNIRLSL
jgi:transposase